jgi:hypothetical protein
LARRAGAGGHAEDIVDRLAKVLAETAQRADVRENLRRAGFAATGREPQAFAKRIADDVPKWKEAIEKARISVTRNSDGPANALLCLVHRLAAIDVDRLPGHEVARRRREKHHRSHQVGRHLHALDGAAGDAGGEIISR